MVRQGKISTDDRARMGDVRKAVASLTHTDAGVRRIAAAMGVSPMTVQRIKLPPGGWEISARSARKAVQWLEAGCPIAADGTDGTRERGDGGEVKLHPAARECPELEDVWVEEIRRIAKLDEPESRKMLYRDSLGSLMARAWGIAAERAAEARARAVESGDAAADRRASHLSSDRDRQTGEIGAHGVIGMDAARPPGKGKPGRAKPEGGRQRRGPRPDGQKNDQT